MSNKTVNRSWELLNLWLNNGRKFGYPECCINQFLTLAVRPWWYFELPWYPTRTLKLNGYVPCEKCAKMPRQKLVDDINSRRKLAKIK